MAQQRGVRLIGANISAPFRQQRKEPAPNDDISLFDADGTLHGPPPRLILPRPTSRLAARRFDTHGQQQIGTPPRPHTELPTTHRPLPKHLSHPEHLPFAKRRLARPSNTLSTPFGPERSASDVPPPEETSVTSYDLPVMNDVAEDCVRSLVHAYPESCLKETLKELETELVARAIYIAALESDAEDLRFERGELQTRVVKTDAELEAARQTVRDILGLLEDAVKEQRGA